MRFFRYSALAVMAAALLFIAGCKDDASNPVEPGVTPSMSAKVNGTNWTAGTVTVMELQDMYTIRGQAGDQSITLQFTTQPAAIGKIDMVQGLYIVGSDSYSSLALGDDEQNVNITKVDANQIQGTFEFKSAAQPSSPDVMAISGGSFTVKLK